MGGTDDVREGELERPDGRVVAWTECGDPRWRPVLRFPGTPMSRWSIRDDREPWIERRLWMITSERPGFGRSTRLPGRGFAEHADDLAAILDHLGIERVHVIGESGGAPHVLAFCARHPERIEAATVTVGAAPVEDDEIDRMVPLNAAVTRAAAAGDRKGVETILRPVHEALRDDPVAALLAVMESAPDDDRAVLSDPGFQAALVRGQQEAHAQGIDGWVDEVLATAGSWSEVEVDAIDTSVTWWHAAGDRNHPLSAARRLVDRIPTARLVEWNPDAGHLHGHHREREILDELLARHPR